MSSFRRYAKYLVSCPKLYRIYQNRGGQSSSSSPALPSQYRPSFIESVTDATITYILPLTLLLSIYQRKVSYLQLTILVYFASRFLRSLSRLTNPDYLQFLNVLEAAVESPNNTESLESLRSYDFEFSYFPVQHRCDVNVSDYIKKQRIEGGVRYYVSWLMAHTFGIRLIYPGLILGGVLRNVLEDGRGKLVVEKNGKRVKIQVQSQDGGVVDIDAMVFDKRGTRKGDVLVICCEGNAGFYEIGMLGGALSEGYSVLGWNHPGFGGSTGTPYPPTELTASLGVMEYATNVLGFKESSIMVYGWSIGGFPATYLASRYPNIKGLVLDATFDTILPLAVPRMPEFMSPLVVSTINNHVNLDNLENLREYVGPIRIVRRVDDEIIADPPGVLACNRGNPLLVEHILSRYGREVPESAKNDLVDWVNTPHDRDVPPHDCLAGDNVLELIKTDPETTQQHSNALIAIASSILRDYKSTHCTPLPREYYRISK